MTLFSRFLFLSLIATFVSSCGGGGGQPATTSVAQQASIDSGNINGYVSKVTLAVQAALTTEVNRTLTIQNINGNNFDGTATGCRVGSVLFSLTKDISGNVAGTGNYTGYDNCIEMTLAGGFNITGTMTNSVINTFKYSFTNFSYTPTGATSAYRLTGNLILNWKASSGGSAGYIMTINATLNDSSGATVVKLENFIVDSDFAAGVQKILVSGRVIDPVQGYIDISTASRIQFYTPGKTPWTGEYKIMGSDNITTVTYASGNYVVAFSPI